MSVSARRVAAVIGGALFGLAIGASVPSVATTSPGEGLTFGGLAAGLGIGLMVAAMVRG